MPLCEDRSAGRYQTCDEEANMHSAVAALQKTARQLQLSGGLEPSKYSRIMSQLREVTNELSASERQMKNRKAAPVNYTVLLREAMPANSADADPSGSQRAISAEDILVEGPAQDLRNAIGSLIEFASAAGRDGLDLRVELKRGSDQARDVCTTELAVRSPDVPDFLRRRLWDAVRLRRGEVSVVSEPNGSRVTFTLPVERRRAASSEAA